MDKQTIRDALTVIAEECGGVLKPEEVVRRASDPQHPLHSCFTWDDGSAANAWRLEQARSLIRSARIIIHPRQEAPTQQLRLAPAFVRDPTKAGDQQGYVSVLAIKNDIDRARDVMLAYLSRVESALARAMAVATVLGLQDELAELAAHVASFAQLVPTATEGRPSVQ
jgi:hypothetical protein